MAFTLTSSKAFSSAVVVMILSQHLPTTVFLNAVFAILMTYPLEHKSIHLDVLVFQFLILHNSNSPGLSIGTLDAATICVDSESISSSKEILCTDISKNHKKTVKKRANTDTRNGRAQEKPKIQRQSQKKSTLSQLQSTMGQQSQLTRGQIPNVSFQSLQVSNVTQMVLNATLAGKEAQEKLGFALIALTKEAHMSLSRIAKLAIRVSSIVIQGP
ncbi:hypothetical protein Tco_0520858 [Tanacetum coccineum]